MLDTMVQGESQLNNGWENPNQQPSRTSGVQSSGVNIHNVPKVDWARPPRFTMNPSWEVEAGTESQEMHTQIQRVSRIPEAIYLQDSEIPANPSDSPSAYDSQADDSSVPLIPLEWAEEVTFTDDGRIPISPMSPTLERGETASPFTIPSLSPAVDGRPEVSQEVMVIALALFAVMKANEPGSNIDLELLIYLLRNPDLLERLLREHGLWDDAFVPLSIPRPMAIRPTGSDIGPLATVFAPVSTAEAAMTSEILAANSLQEPGEVMGVESAAPAPQNQIPQSGPKKMKASGGT